MTLAKMRLAFICLTVLWAAASCSPSSPAASPSTAASTPTPTAALASHAAEPATGAPANSTPQTAPDPTMMAILAVMEADSHALLAFMTSTPELRALFGGVYLDHPGQWPDVSGSQTVLQLRATAAEAEAVRRQLPPLSAPERLRIDLVQCTDADLQTLYDQLLYAPAVVELMNALALDTRHNAVELVLRPAADWVEINGVIDKSSLPAEVFALVDNPCIVVSQADVQVTRLPALDVTATP